MLFNKIRETAFQIVARGDKHKTASRVYDLFMLTMIAISVLPLVFRGHYPIFTAFDYVSTVAFILDYIVRWSTADLLLKRGSKSFVIYPLTPMAIIDLVSILPGLNVIDKSFKLFRLTRIFYIFRVLRLFRYSHKIMSFLAILKKQKDVLLSVLLLAIVYIFITAIVMFNVEPDINPATGQPTFKSFFDALYWSTTTLTTVGYGDIVPVSTAGRIVSMLSAVFGVAIIALPSGVITGAYLGQLKKERHENGNDDDDSDNDDDNNE